MIQFEAFFMATGGVFFDILYFTKVYFVLNTVNGKKRFHNAVSVIVCLPCVYFRKMVCHNHI